MSEFKWIWKFLKQYKLKLLTAFALVTVFTLLNMVNPYVQGMIVDKVITGGKTEIFLTLAMVMVVTTLLKSLTRYIFQFLFENVSQSVIYNIRETAYKKVQEMDFEFFDKNKTGDIMSRMTGDLEAVRGFTAGTIYSIFLNSLTFITVMIILFSMNALFTIMLLSVAPFIGIFTYKLAGKVKPVFSAIREQFARLNSVVQENISGNRVVKAFTREDYEIHKFSAENGAFRERNLDAAKVWEKYLPVLDSMAGVLSVIIILAGGIMIIYKKITLGELVTFNGFIWALNNPMRMAGWLINDTQRFAASAGKIMGLLNREPKIKNPKHAESSRIKGLIEFRNVSFGYDNTEVLKGINFKAVPGQTIAIVGPTGSGKSTLTSLISRFYECTGGKILIDGIDIRKYDLRKLRDDIAVAMQDIFLFSDTIEGNISYGVPDISFESVKRAAETASAHEFITGFSEGYDTIIGERGVGLSGGQKQRIALSRALVKDPAVLVLDDTTSSVDIETEHEIHKALKEFYRNKTTFVIAHRISSVKNADLILVMDKGRIVERGTHEELLALKGYYHSVFMNQYGDFDIKLSELVG